MRTGIGTYCFSKMPALSERVFYQAAGPLGVVDG
jgi:hypothetical protein